MLVAGLGILLAACAKGEFQTFKAAGEALPQAEFQIIGKTKYDQIWVDKTIEAEVAGFGMKRPKARPANLGGVAAAKAPARARVLKPAPSVRAPSHGGAIALPAPHTNAPTGEVALPTPKPAPSAVVRKPSAMQRLRSQLDAAKARIRKLEGR